ncbi:MAG TPA: LEA type 2 family protein [Thermoanaerobaculia bacterium]|nr:LEA type 2 family protein [Thermoanaerobaculia bacterium]
MAGQTSPPAASAVPPPVPPVPAARLILFAALLLAGCAGFGHLFKEPKVELAEATVSGLSRSGASLILSFDIANPNGVRIPLSGVDYRVSVNGERLLAGSENDRVDIPAHAATRVDVPVTLRYDDILKVLKTLGDHPRALYDIQAELRFAVPVVGTVKVPVEKRREIPLPELRFNLSDFLSGSHPESHR